MKTIKNILSPLKERIDSVDCTGKYKIEIWVKLHFINKIKGVIKL